MNRARHIIILLMLACVLPYARGETSSEPPPTLSPVVIPDMPEDDRKMLLQGTWWAQRPTILPDPSEAADPADASLPPVSPSLGEAQTAVDPYPEDNRTINEQFLPEYIRQAPLKIIDPQRILSETEKNDVLQLINALEETYGVKIFVSLFAPGQEIPPAVNAPALARQILPPGQRGILLHAHYGEILSLQVACDTKWIEQMGDRGRRALLAKIKEGASLYTDPQDSLMESIAAMVLFAQPGMQEMLDREQAEQEMRQDIVPPVDIEFTETETPKKARLGDYIGHFKDELHQYAYHLATLLLLGAGALLYLIWRRNYRPITLPPVAPDRRLGAPHGAGVSRVVGYGDKEDSRPDSLSRQQMRDHLRDIS